MDRDLLIFNQIMKNNDQYMIYIYIYYTVSYRLPSYSHMLIIILADFDLFYFGCIEIALYSSEFSANMLSLLIDINLI